MATDTTDLILEILKRLQADMRGLQQSFVDVARLIQRMDTRFSDTDRRISELKADLETMFKMELIGQHAHQQTRIELMLDDRLSSLEERLAAPLDRIEAKLAT